MIERAVIDTGPIIAMIRAEALEVLARLPIAFVCPPQVESETRAGSDLGHPFSWPTSLETVQLVRPLHPIALAALGEGETAVIQLALEQNIEWVCMDDRKGRRAALAVGLKVVGTLGLLARAKTAGIIPTVRPVIDRLMREGIWYDRGLVQRVILAVGE